jgi:hypothetical protein
MTTPYRGRGRGRGFGRGIGSGRGGNNMLPYQESNIPLIGDWTTVGKLRQLPAPNIPLIGDWTTVGKLRQLTC